MANKKAEQPVAAEAPKENKYRDGRWTTPSKRAKGYAEDRKARVHTYGPKLGKQLTDFEAGKRPGEPPCPGDHAGIYKFKKGSAEGKRREEALALSKRPWGKKNNGGDAA